MTGDLYVQSVINQVPHGLPLRDQIALELRGHIAERVANGQPLDEVLRRLGDPLTLAESYLAAVTFESAGLLPRLAAKLIDVAIVAVTAVAIATALMGCAAEGGIGLCANPLHSRRRSWFRGGTP
jgi:hypothetical protein